LAFLVNCNNPIDGNAPSGFKFCVADVGQGLAQFGVINNRAVAFDVGPKNQHPAWRAAYAALGSPRIESIVISHSDEDHCGGLALLDGRVDWSGALMVSPYEDTAKIRASSGAWADRIRFQFCRRGDTLRTLNSVEIICLWPPEGIAPELPLDNRLRNHYSLVFSVRHGYSRALVTSDIDSSAMAEIAAHSAHGLQAQLLSAPHHGSAGSVNQLFFSYTSAETAIISCSKQNSYGHPSQRMIDELMYFGVRILYTYIDNTVVLSSNGYDWY
jgi:competence protein ComEC